MSFSFKTLIKVLSKEDLISIAQSNPDIDQIALKLNLNRAQVRYLYSKIGVSIRSSKNKVTTPTPPPTPSKEELKALEGNTLQHICKTLNLKPRKVLALYSSYGFKAPSKQSNYCTSCRIPKEELNHLYHVLNQSLTVIGDKYKVSKQTVSNWMMLYKIPLRTRGSTKQEKRKKNTHPIWNLTKEELVEKLSNSTCLKDLCQTEDMSVNTYQRVLKFHNLKSPFDKQKLHLSEEELKDLYLNKNLTLVQISEMKNVHYQTICRLVKKYGLVGAKKSPNSEFFSSK